MPAFLGLLVSAVAGAAAELVGGGVIGALVGGAIVVGGGVLVSAFGPKKPDLGALQRDLAVPTSIANRRTQIRQNLTSSVGSIPVVYGQVRVGGLFAHVATSGSDRQYLHQILVLSEGEIEEVTTIYVDGSDSTADKFSGLLTTRSRVGTDTQSALDADLNIPSWGNFHNGYGLAYIYVRALQDKLFSRIPQLEAKIKGVKCYDPRSSLTAWTQNPALIIRDYMTNSRYGKGHSSSEIDDDSFEEAANHCDETVTYPDGTTGPRYQMNGVVLTEQSIRDNLKEMLSACRGVLVFAGGKWRLKIDKAETASFTFTEDNIIGGWSLSRAGKRGKKNRMEVQFLNATNGYEPDIITVDSSVYLADDNSRELIGRLDLPFTTNRNIAKMLGMMALKQTRNDLTIEFTAQISAMEVECFDVVYVTHSSPGWTQKKFRVVTIQHLGNDDYRFTLQEYDADVYDLSTLTDSPVDDGSDLPSPTDINPPGNPVVTDTSSQIQVQVDLEWAPSDDFFINHYNIEYKLSSSSTWLTASPTVSTNTTLNLDATGTYDFRVQGVNSLGVGSAWATTSNVEVTGDNANPADITGFYINAIHNNAHLLWDPVADLDVLQGGHIRVKHSTETTGATWTNSIEIAYLAGTATDASVPLKTGTYLIKAVDRDDHESDTAASVVITQADIVALSLLLTNTQHPDFTGTKTNMVVDTDTDTLILSGVTNWDSVAGNFDDVGGLFDMTGDGFVSSGSYEFGNSTNSVAYDDLGSVVTARIVPLITFVAGDQSLVWDDLNGNWDDIEGLFDGDDLGNIDIKFFVKTTSDNPAGTPTWSDWQLITVSADFVYRAAKYKLEVTTVRTTVNIAVSALQVKHYQAA